MICGCGWKTHDSPKKKKKKVSFKKAAYRKTENWYIEEVLSRQEIQGNNKNIYKIGECSNILGYIQDQHMKISCTSR